MPGQPDVEIAPRVAQVGEPLPFRIGAGEAADRSGELVRRYAARRLKLELVQPANVPADAKLPGSDGQAPVELEVDAGRRLRGEVTVRFEGVVDLPGCRIATEQRAPVVVRSVNRIVDRVEAVQDGGSCVHVSDDIVDLDPIPVDRELQVTHPGRLEPRAQDDAGGDRIGGLRVELRVAADSRQDRRRRENGQQLHREALLDAQCLDQLRVGPVPQSALSSCRARVEESTKLDVPGRNNSKIDGTRTARW